MAVTYKEYPLPASSGVIEYKNFSKYNTLFVDSQEFGEIKSICEHVNDYIINFENSDVTLKNGKKNFKYLKTSEYTEPLVINSSNFPIDIFITAPQRGTTVNGTPNDDKILLSAYPVSDINRGLTINAGKGNDYIEGTSGSDKITGGIGTNTIFYNRTDFGNDTIVLTKNEHLNIEFDNKKVWGNFSYTPVNNYKDLEITSENFINSKIVIKDYISKDIGAAVSINGLNIAEKPSLGHVTASNWFEQADKKPNDKYTGTAVADYVDASAVSYNAKKPLTIKTGTGNDTIIASSRIDNISGGSGYNTIIYNNKISLNGDKISLTKGESLDINVSNITSYSDIYYKVNGKDLDITFSDNGITENTFTIINFGTKDPSDNSTKNSEDTSKIRLITNKGTVDLTKDLLSELKIYSNYTGTWHADNINAQDAGKGLRIDGGAGKDKIIGSASSDTITGGAGNDTINAGSGDNTIIFSQGCGNDIIQNGGGVDTLCINGVKYNSIFAYFLENDNNLYIDFGTKGDCITVENFAEDYASGTNSVQKIKAGNKTYSVDDFLPESFLDSLNSSLAAWMPANNKAYDTYDTLFNFADPYDMPVCSIQNTDT